MLDGYKIAKLDKVNRADFAFFICEFCESCESQIYQTRFSCAGLFGLCGSWWVMGQ